VNGLVVPQRISFGELLVLLGLVALVFHRLSRSWYGLAARAVREDPAVAATMGISPYRIQFTAFIISGIVGGLGGAPSPSRSSSSRPRPTSSASPSR
jgi:branched-chain amino acid transport system permease protein